MDIREASHLVAVPGDATRQIFDFQLPHVRVDAAIKRDGDGDFRDDALIKGFASFLLRSLSSLSTVSISMMSFWIIAIKALYALRLAASQ